MSTSEETIKAALDSVLCKPPSISAMSLIDFVMIYRTVKLVLPRHFDRYNLAARLAESNDAIVTNSENQIGLISRMYNPVANVVSLEEAVRLRNAQQLPLRLWIVFDAQDTRGLYTQLVAPGQTWVHLSKLGV